MGFRARSAFKLLQLEAVCRGHWSGSGKLVSFTEIAERSVPAAGTASEHYFIQLELYYEYSGEILVIFNIMNIVTLGRN